MEIRQELQRTVEQLDKLTGIGGFDTFLWACQKILFEEFAIKLVTEEDWNRILSEQGQIRVADILKIAEEKEVQLSGNEAKQVFRILRRHRVDAKKTKRRPIALSDRIRLLLLPKQCGYQESSWDETCGSTEDLQYGHIISHKHGGPRTEENLMWICGRHNRQLSSKDFIWG